MARSLKNMMGAGIGAGTAQLINGTVADGLTATGSTQADALILTNDVNVVSTVPVGSGVRLLANPQPGDDVLVTNLGANALSIYPSIGANIGGGAANLPFSLPAGATSEFVARTGSANWVALASGGSGGGGGGGGGTATPALIGINNYTPGYYNLSKAYANYLQYAEYFEYQDSSNNWAPLPDSYVPANGWPNSAPSLDAGGHYTFRKILSPASSAPQAVNVTWVGNIVSAGVSGGASSWSQTNATSGTFTITLSMASALPPASPTYPVFQYTITSGDANYARQFFIAASGVTLAEPTWVTDMNAILAPGAPIRMMDASMVNGNMGIWPGVPQGTIFPSPTVTAASRNTPTGGNWGIATTATTFNGTPHGNDGWPIEVQFALANSVNRPLWTSLQPNGSNDYFDAIATWIRDYETTVQPGQSSTQPWPTGRKIYLQLSNETWNSAFPYWDQAQREATANGITTQQRVAQRSSQIFKRFETILAGKMNRIVRILDFQEGSDPVILDTLLPYNIGDGTTVLSHHDMVTIAAYFDASNSDPTNLTQAFADLYSNIDVVVAINKAYKDKANSKGLLFGSYEGGNGTSWPSNEVQRKAFVDDARMEAAVGYFLQQYASVVGTDVPVCWYADYAHESGGSDWGLKYYTGGPDTPASTAFKNHVLGKLYLPPLGYSTQFTKQGNSNGSTFGAAPSRTVAGTTYSIVADTTGGAVGVNPSTGQLQLADTTKLTVVGTFSATVRASNPAAANSPVDTVVSFQVKSSAFIPLDLGAVAWYEPTVGYRFTSTDHSAAASDTNALGCIANQGTGVDVTQATAANRPIVHDLTGKSFATFDGINDCLASQSVMALTDGSGQWTAYAAFKFDSLPGGGAAMSVIDADSAGGLSAPNRVAQFIRAHGSNIEAIAFSNAGSPIFATGSTTLTTGTWYNVVVVCTTATLKIYLNGVLEATGTVGAALQSGTQAIGLGANNANPSLTGGGAASFLAGEISCAGVRPGSSTLTDIANLNTYLVSTHA